MGADASSFQISSIAMHRASPTMISPDLLTQFGIAGAGHSALPYIDNCLAAERLAGVLKALAEPTRLRLVSLIAAHAGAEACVCDLTDTVGLSQPTVSHHLKILVDAGLLDREQRGKWAYYRLMPGALDALAGMLTRTSRQR